MKHIVWLFIAVQGMLVVSASLADTPPTVGTNPAVNSDSTADLVAAPAAAEPSETDLAVTKVSLLPTDSSIWYLGSKFGSSQFGNVCSSDALTCESEDTGVGIFGGWQVNEWFGLELSYTQLGEASATYAIPAGLALTGEGSAADIAARFRWAFADRWGLYGKTGFAYTYLEADDGSSSNSASDLSLLFGCGVSYDFTDSWQTRLEYQYISEMGNNVTGYTDNQFVSLSIAYYFGKRKTALKPSSAMVPITIPALTVSTVFDFESTQMKLVGPIDQMIARLLKFPEATAEITGYTDNAGPAAYNATLSIRRAKAVRDYMVSKGVDEKRISFQGLGGDESIIDNDTASNRLLNRRVKVYSPPIQKSINVKPEDFVMPGEPVPEGESLNSDLQSETPPSDELIQPESTHK